MSKESQRSEVDEVLALLQPPKAIALYGASDKSQWSRSIFACIRGYGFAGPMYAINQRGAPAHGLQGFQRASELPPGVDTAYVFVPAEAVVDAMHDLGRAGVRKAVILSSGFAELGSEGQALQDAVVAAARQEGIRFIGPNSLGFAAIAAGHAVTALPPPRPLLRGHVAVVSQSGAVCSEIADYAVQQGIGLSMICAVGNEAQVDASAVIHAMVEDEDTKAIAVFAESIREPAAFERAALASRAARKPLLIFKVGASEVGAAVAQAHTGSLVGDDRVFDAMCRRHAVVRVESLEDLVTTAGLLAHTGVIERPGVAVVSLSGGGCGIVADAADKLGVPLPAFGSKTVQALRAELPGFAATLNPLDITGAVIRKPELFVPCLHAAADDPGIGLTIAAYSVFSDEERLQPRMPLVEAIGTALRELGPRAILVSATVRPYTGAGLRAVQEVGIRGFFGGLAGTMRAVGKALWWSAQMRESVPAASSVARAPGPRGDVPVLADERAVLEHLAGHGVPVIPAHVARSAAEVGAAQAALGGSSLALKILSPDIQHKTEVGGVRLNVAAHEVGAAYEELLAQVRRKAPDARIEGVIVSPMRAGGTELLVGVSRDPQWGPVLTIALGGVWIELLRDSALRLLPLRREEVLEMLGELRGIRLLQGYRGAPAADLHALAGVIERIGEVALALGPRLAVLEINPLRVGPEGCEALDGLVVWKEETR